MYDVLAAYYDIVHDQLTEDLDFVLTLAQEYGGPILELGCGTGRLVLPLVLAGHFVTGIDNEQSMLDLALQRLNRETEEIQQRAALHLDDIRSFSLPSAASNYRLAIFSYNTLLHFQAGEIVKTLRRVKRCLAKDGLLFVDVANPYSIEDDIYEDYPVLEDRFTNPTTGETVVQMSHSRLDSMRQCLHTTWYFESQEVSEQLSDRVSVEMDYWYQFPHQLELMLQQSGFRLEQVMGDYDRTGFNEESSRLLIFARPAA